MKTLMSVVCLAAVVLPAGSASATMPGMNGKIAFSTDRDGNREIYAMNPDGSDQTNLTNDPARDESPAWSPDGDRIAFVSDRELGTFDQYQDLWTMNADGTGLQRLTMLAGVDSAPTWSPDGARLAFTAAPHGGTGGGLYTINADGSEMTFVGTLGLYPAWSPYGEPIALAANGIRTVNSDGTGVAQLTFDASHEHPNWSPDYREIVFDRYAPDGFAAVDPSSAAQRDIPGTFPSDNDPAWSPDGTKLVFSSAIGATSDQRISVIQADGTGRVGLTGDSFDSTEPDWQPLDPTPVLHGYPRPKGATPVRISLVPAFKECTGSWENRTHGPPLAHPACNPPQPFSPNLTVGTPDSNGAAPNSRGEVKLHVTPGNTATPADEADVRLDTFVLDVRCRITVVEDPETQGFPCVAGAMADYTGEIELLPSIRITDKLNGDPATRTGVVQDFDMPITVPCTATADSAIGATCSLSTTFDSLLPGMVTEGKRAIWALGRIHIHDAGVDGDAELNRPEQVEFMTQGVFVP